MKEQSLYTMEKYLLVFSDVFFVNGYTRTMICDVKKEYWNFIGNEYYELLPLFKKKKIADIIKEDIEENSIPFFIDFIEFLVENNYATFVYDLSLFPDVKMEWDSPRHIQNAIIDVDEQSLHNFLLIAEELEKLLCKNVQFRFFCDLTTHSLLSIISFFIDRDFETIDFLLKYNAGIHKDFYLETAGKYPSVSFIIYNSPVNEFNESHLKKIYLKVGYVQYIKQNIISSCNCGIINLSTFLLNNNLKDFLEGVLRNKCLNRKIAVDCEGNIKNCPSLTKSYGNINKGDSLLKVMKEDSFKKYWYITKDQIVVCKDCEFRYVCSDCRAFTSGILDKPLKCKYDPYKGSWEV